MRGSSFERFAGAKGVSEQDKKEFIQSLGGELFEAAKHLEVAGEIPKTPEQIEIVTAIDQQVGEVVLKYGGRNIAITPDHVRITNDPSQIVEEGGGQFQPERQLVIQRSPDNDLDFAYKTAHELLHFKSYGAMQVPLDKTMSPDMYYRVGLRLNNRTDTQVFFNALEEGMTEELTKRLITDAKKELPQFKSIVEETDMQVGKRDLDAALKDDLIYLDENGDGRRFTYIKERESIQLLIHKILEKRQEEQNDPEMIFDVFARAKFTGNILPLARLIDGTFGAGTFRKIGEAFTGSELQEVVESL